MELDMSAVIESPQEARAPEIQERMLAAATEQSHRIPSKCSGALGAGWTIIVEAGHPLDPFDRNATLCARWPMNSRRLMVAPLMTTDLIQSRDFGADLPRRPAQRAPRLVGRSGGRLRGHFEDLDIGGQCLALRFRPEQHGDHD